MNRKSLAYFGVDVLILLLFFITIKIGSYFFNESFTPMIMIFPYLILGSIFVIFLGLGFGNMFNKNRLINKIVSIFMSLLGLGLFIILYLISIEASGFLNDLSDRFELLPIILFFTAPILSISGLVSLFKKEPKPLESQKNIEVLGD